MSGVISALPVRNSTSPCKPSSTSEASSLAVCAVCTFCERSSSFALRAWLLSANWLFSPSKVDFSLCSCDLSLSSSATCASAFLASLARCTRLPSHVPSPAPTTAPIGPAANPPMTAPVMNPAGSCGGRGLGSSARAAALMPIKPIVQTTLEYLVLMTNSSLSPHSRRRPPPHGSHYGPAFRRDAGGVVANHGEAATNCGRGAGAPRGQVLKSAPEVRP